MTPAPQIVAIGGAPHGEVIAHTENKIIVAANDGMNVVTLANGAPGAKVVVPYNLDGRTGGRAFYARLSGDGKFVYSYLRNDGYNPTTMMSWKWKDWESDAYVLDIEKATAKRIVIGKGLVYRLADSPKYALFVQYHPDGDFAHIMDTAKGSPTFQTIVAKIPLDKMSKAPGPDGSPWESTAFRIAGMTPDGKWGFVTHGADGLVSVIDLDMRKVVGKIKTPTKLNGGGYLLGVNPGAKFADTIGR
jgi:DNA-binding beta-propeller fold protein YncE